MVKSEVAVEEETGVDVNVTAMFVVPVFGLTVVLDPLFNCLLPLDTMYA